MAELDPEQQMMVQALSGPGVAPQPDPSQPSQMPNLDPSLAAMFLVPKAGTNWGQSGTYDAIHDSGKRAGFADLSYNPNSKDVHVNFMAGQNSPDWGFSSKVPGSGGAGFESSGHHSVGPAEMQGLGYEVKRVFPDAQTTSGLRVSGARGKLQNQIRQEHIAQLPGDYQWEELTRRLNADPRYQKVTQNVVRPLPQTPEAPAGRILTPHEYDMARALAPGASGPLNPAQAAISTGQPRGGGMMAAPVGPLAQPRPAFNGGGFPSLPNWQ